MRAALLGAVATACMLCGPARAATSEAAVSAPRTDILLNGMWETSRSADPSTGPWARVRVPEPLVKKKRDPVSYRLRFTLPPGLRRDRRAVLAFEKAGHHVRVTLNGTRIGEHYGTRLPFAFDVTDTLREGTENELVIWAAPADAANARPGGVPTADEAKAYDVFLVSEPAGWYPPGIFGDVVLRLVPALRVEDVFVRTSFRHRTIDVTLEIANHGATAATATVRTEVVSLDGAPTEVRLSDETITLPPAGRATVDRAGAFPGARPWPDGADTPPLYVLRTTLLADSRTTDVATQRFGFREVWTEGQHLVLNGKRLPVAASIVTAFTERQRLAHLFNAFRTVGLNFVHLHWDDGTRSFYDLADEAGMLVMPELYCSGPLPLTRPVVGGPAWVDDMARAYDTWAELRRNHPSIALWSPYDFPPAPGVRPADLEGFDRIVRTADPTRPILGVDVLETAIGEPHAFVADPRDPQRVAYEAKLARSRAEGRPLLVNEIARMVDATSEDVRAIVERFGRDGITGFGGLHLEQALFRSRVFALEWPSSSGHDGRPPAVEGGLRNIVNWSDPTRPAVMRTEYGRLLRRILPKALGTAATPRAFVRSPELLVVGPASCGGRGYALAAPVTGAGAVERATLLDPQGKGWLLLTEPGTYRVRLVCDGERAITVNARGRPFGPPGFGHLQEVRLDTGS